ncbi:peptidoglycan DD-metalloendopeptidase family protein [Methyloglobulus sp.]|uniref:murein hydrolase activator EnvC family protein n=1 Tax=Methyloglobulus sp. TaxID=2518622 RepID=UPI0039894416
MIFQASKPSVLAVWTLIVLLTACAQPTNYAPVKTVNQAIEPNNGYVREKMPISPDYIQGRPQQSTESLHKEQEDNPVRQNPVINRLPYPDPYQNQSYQNPTDQAIKKEDLRSSNTAIVYQNQGVLKQHPLPYNVEPSIINKPVHPAVDKNPASKPQRSPTTDQQPIDPSKNNSIISITNIINQHKNPQNNAKPLDKFWVTQKNNKEKKSIISIDNKKMLKLNFQWPLQGKIFRNFSQTDNKGIDIKGKVGQPVHAAEAGKAVYCGQGLAGFGNLAIIKHNETYLSAYANNSKLYIKEGQQVEKGQTIGQVGLTGLKKASLHFEIRKNGKPINPLTLLPKH